MKKIILGLFCSSVLLLNAQDVVNTDVVAEPTTETAVEEVVTETVVEEAVAEPVQEEAVAESVVEEAVVESVAEEAVVEPVVEEAVAEPVVEEANIINTGKTEYKIGEVFTIDDFVGQLVYSNDFTENVFKTNAEFVVTIPELEGDTPIVPDEYVMDYEIDSAKVIVKYGDVEFTYDISVAEADPEGKIQFKANSVKVASGQSFVLDVHMSGNPGILALKSTLEFNEDVFELKRVTVQKVFDRFEESSEPKNDEESSEPKNDEELSDPESGEETSEPENDEQTGEPENGEESNEIEIGEGVIFSSHESSHRHLHACKHRAIIMVSFLCFVS